MKTFRVFRVYFNNGNQKLFEARNMLVLMNYLVDEMLYHPNTITKIEEVTE